MGCRVAAFVTVLVIVGVDLLTNIAAYPSRENADRAVADRIARSSRARRAAIEDDIVPVHKRKLDHGARETFSPDASAASLQAYTFTAPSDSRLSIKFTTIDLNSYTDDYVAAYSGVPHEELFKGKTTAVNDGIQRSDFRSQMARLPFLLSTRDPTQSYQDRALMELNRKYFSDENLLTITFDQQSPSRGFTALIEVVKVAESTYRERRDPLNDGPNSGSFSVCDKGKQDAKVITQGDGGTIISHPGYKSQQDMGEKWSTDTCKVDIEIPDAKNINFEIETMGLTSSEPTCDSAYFEIYDVVRDKSTKICDKTEKGKKYEFSNKIKLTINPGTWSFDVKGFSILYTIIREKQEEDTKDSGSDILALGPDVIPGPVNPTRAEAVPEIPVKNLKSVTLLGDIDSANVSPTKDSTTAHINKTRERQTLPAIFIISVIVVAILLIIILSAAGAIACYRTHQHDQLFNSSTLGRLIPELSENGTSMPPDASNQSLCQHGCQVAIGAGMYKTGVLTPPDGSHTSIVQVAGGPIDLRGSRGKAQKYYHTESDRLLSSSPSTSEENKPPSTTSATTPNTCVKPDDTRQITQPLVSTDCTIIVDEASHE